ncbi:MAG: hypothetical protein Kow00133_17760 [Amphiplicatus sp.]
MRMSAGAGASQSAANAAASAANSAVTTGGAFKTVCLGSGLPPLWFIIGSVNEN